MRLDMDQLLRQALSPEKEPDNRLNQKIIQKSKETETMIKKNKKGMMAALVAVGVLMIGSLSAFATWKYLTPDQAAEQIFHDEALSKAFQGEDAIVVNETQEMGDYRVTFLGIVSGKNLSDYTDWKAEQIQEDKTYAIIAIENRDGTPRPDVSDEHYGEDAFFISPIISGLNPWEYSIMTMGGSYSEDVVDGIQYRLVECDNVEMFADRGLYLCVQSGTFYDNQAYSMDEATGAFTRNESYEGLNILFDLPIDESKADPAAAQVWYADARPSRSRFRQELKAECR